jgi:hypothetical protein
MKANVIIVGLSLFLSVTIISIHGYYFVVNGARDVGDGYNGTQFQIIAFALTVLPYYAVAFFFFFMIELSILAGLGHKKR